MDKPAGIIFQNWRSREGDMRLASRYLAHYSQIACYCKPEIGLGPSIRLLHGSLRKAVIRDHVS